MNEVKYMIMESGESRESFVARCRAAVHDYLVSFRKPRPFIVDSTQTGGCYHGHPHKQKTYCGLAGRQPAVMSAEPHSECGANYSPTQEAIALVGEIL